MFVVYIFVCQIGTKVIKDAVSAARSRESSPMIRSPGGLRPFQRGIIWSINSIKYLYNDLVRRNGDIDNLILLHQANEPNLFRCLDMDRLSYVVKYVSQRRMLP